MAPDGMAPGLEVAARYRPPTEFTWSNATHGCIVEVDPETGMVDIKRYVVSEDCGQMINPMLVEGQIQGGFAHGLGYALFEELIYQPDGGFQSASFLDYTMVSAPEVSAELILLPMETRTDANPESFKGAGESGTVPVPAAIANAIEDAIRQVRPEARITELPITPMRVFEALA